MSLLATWQLSSTNFFVRNFITVSNCFSSFSKNTILSLKRSTTKPDEASVPLSESRDTFCTLLLAIITSSVGSGFDLTARDSYFTILVEVFTNHILAENTYFTNNKVNRTQDYGL